MSAREWLRRRLAGSSLRLAFDEIAHLAAARADALHVAEKLGRLLDERTVERDQARAELAEARRLLGAMHAGRDWQAEHERAVRHAEAEQTGGR